MLHALGILLSAGQPLSEVLDRMTFQQAFLAADAIVMAKAKALDSVMGPIVRSGGGEYTDTKVTGPKSPVEGGLTEAQKKDLHRMHKAASLGIRYK